MAHTEKNEVKRDGYKKTRPCSVIKKKKKSKYRLASKYDPTGETKRGDIHA